MTDRQKRIFAHVRPYLSELYAEAEREMANMPVGMSLQCRVPAPLFVNSPFCSPLSWSVHIVKTLEGFQFRVEDFWHQKGHTPPKFRRLLPSVGENI